MRIRDWWKKNRSDVIARLWLVLLFAVSIGLALLVKNCAPDDRDEQYDKHLEEYYDGLERYDPV